jgi:hypothetical protein
MISRFKDFVLSLLGEVFPPGQTATGPLTWTENQEFQARAQGWCMYETEEGHQLQKCDGQVRFRSDGEVWEFVSTMAEHGDYLASHALNFLAVNSPSEYALICNYAGRPDFYLAA